jgi:hypothetical protein
MSKMEARASNIRRRHCAVLMERPRHRKLPDADTPKAPYCRRRTTQHGPPTDAGAVEYRGSRTASRSSVNDTVGTAGCPLGCSRPAPCPEAQARSRTMASPCVECQRRTRGGGASGRPGSERSRPPRKFVSRACHLTAARYRTLIAVRMTFSTRPSARPRWPR